MRRKDLAFWAKIAVTSLFVNVPLAVGMVFYGLHPVIAFGSAALAGVGSLAIWDRSRTSLEEEAEPATEPTEASHTPSIQQAAHEPLTVDVSPSS